MAFILYAGLVFSKKNVPLIPGLILAVVCRIIGFAAEPLLSDDYFRFIWDGMVMHEGINPVSHTPSYLVHHPEIAETNQGLYSLLNSKEYYSVYNCKNKSVNKWNIFFTENQNCIQNESYSIHSPKAQEVGARYA